MLRLLPFYCGTVPETIARFDSQMEPPLPARFALFCGAAVAESISYPGPRRLPGRRSSNSGRRLGSTDTSGSTGGGIFILSGTLTMTNCTVSGNSAARSDAGGIRNGGTLAMTNCTVSGNTSDRDGGCANPDEESG